jgi:hypothetical protein
LGVLWKFDQNPLFTRGLVSPRVTASHHE